MGNGSGVRGLNSRVYTNSYASLSLKMAFPYRNKGDSFGGFSKPQYSHTTYHNLAFNGAGAGGREGRWLINKGVQIPFIPPK